MPESVESALTSGLGAKVLTGPLTDVIVAGIQETGRRTKVGASAGNNKDQIQKYFLNQLNLAIQNNIKLNHQINYPELRVVSATGENIGVLTREQALALAQEQGLDLILISEGAKPPVAKIIDFDKFRYERGKELKRQHRQRQLEGKQIQIGAKTAPHDLQVKLKKLEEFLTKGHRVEIQMVLRGRERANRDWAKAKLQDFLKTISIPYRVTREIKPGGRGLTVQIDSHTK